MKTVKFKDLPEKVQTFLYENQHSLGYFCPENDIQLNWLHNISIWDKATDEERLAYAEWKYPKGINYICLHIPPKKDGTQLWLNDGVFESDGRCIRSNRGSKCVYDFGSSKWAEIIEEPDALTKAKQALHDHIQSNPEKVKQDLDKMRDLSNEFKAGDEVDCFVENGSEKEWIPAIFYAKAFHEKRPWKECYVVAYKNTGNVDIVTELRKPDPDKVYREIAKEMIGNARVHEFTSIEYITVESAESMLIEALKKGKGL